MSAHDDPAMLDAQRRHKHAKRIPFVVRPDARLTPLEQWENKVHSIALWGMSAKARRQMMPHKTLLDYGLAE